MIFYSWIFPHYLYGAPLWIFQAFKVISCNSKPKYGYGVHFDKLNSLYVKSGKLILGVKGNICQFAVMVRLNWLPLKYVLALQSVFWLYRILKIPNSGVCRLFLDLKNDLQNDEKWGDSIFFKPAYDFLIRLQTLYNNINSTQLVFLEVDNIGKFKKLLKEAAFYEFNDFWEKWTKGRYTYRYFPEITYGKKIIIRNNFNRVGEKIYYGLSFKQNLLNDFKHVYIDNNVSPLCRFCNTHIESIEHVLINCTSLNYTKLQNNCERLKIEYNVKNLLGDLKMKYCVERFLYESFI